jgi:NAD(P)-dependent dehydrogenase (short-subunit alcohol dehydrogenase family)
VTRRLSGFVARELSAKFASCSGGALQRASLLWEVDVLRFEEAPERDREAAAQGKVCDHNRCCASHGRSRGAADSRRNVPRSSSPISWQATPRWWPPTSAVVAGRPPPPSIDVTSEAEWICLMAEAVATDGRLDTLVNNSGISVGEPDGLEGWHRIIARCAPTLSRRPLALFFRTRDTLETIQPAHDINQNCTIIS